MKNENLQAKFITLESKLKKLLEAYHLAQQELKEYKNENDLLKKQIDNKNFELKNFQNQDKISKIATVISEDKKISSEYKSKINEYIKEVEKVLAYINKV
ncbi:MAG: hypothetical protein NW207_12605 [Cytophagales bacterium]|nr:hypothetical protein [Cytophagales bacterium]